MLYEGSVCVCCMSTEDLVDLHESKTASYKNYAMLAVCLNIPISIAEDHESICSHCYSKLKEYIAFKRQALQNLCLLSSIEITELASAADINILELNIESQTISNQENIIEESKEEKEEESHVNEDEGLIEEYLESLVDSDEEFVLANEEKNGKEKKTYNYSEQEESQEDAPPPKRKRGRPRTRPDQLPYRIGSEELRCRECGRQFTCNHTLKAHYNVHFGCHACKTCGKKYMVLGNLKKHEESHLEGPFPCDICGQVYHKLNTLRTHRRLKHTDKPPFRCKHCKAGFRTSQRRLRHLVAAHGLTEKKYACEHCSERFLDSGQLSKHVINKHNVKYHTCHICGMVYRHTYMKTHLKRHEGAMPAASKPHEKRFVCKLCSSAFTQKTTLQRHIESHIRRGLYDGDPTYLIVDTKDLKAKNTGLLSEDDNYPDSSDDLPESNEEESYENPSPENKDGGEGNVAAQDEQDSFNTEQDIDLENDLILNKEEMYEIITDIGFSLSSDFEM